jgi:hypothetical protein
MHTEKTVLPTVLDVLRQAPEGKLSTTELRELVKQRLPLSPWDLEPLRNRNDARIDQIIRNLKCHRNTPGNPFFDGILESDPRGFKLGRREDR